MDDDPSRHPRHADPARDRAESAVPAVAPSEDVTARLELARVRLFVASAVGVLSLVAVAVSAAGAGWAWTGLTSNADLWDWLHLLVLPLVLLLLPLWVRTHIRLGRLWRVGFVVVGVGFVVLVVGGYAWSWTWTGFSGNRLWDWLELLVLPVSVSMLPLWLAERESFARRHVALAAAAAVVFGLVVLFGYVIPWAWTGFVGNTLWDWVNLFLVPFLIPATVTVLRHQVTHHPAGPPADASPRSAVPAEP